MTKSHQNNTSKLVEAFRKGDRNAFSCLYDMFVQPLFNYGMRLTNDSELVKDCIHDVFVKVYQKRHDNIGYNNFSSYLLISLRNRILDEFRHQTLVTEISVDNCHISRYTPDLEHDYINQENEERHQQKVSHLMDSLTRRQRQVFTLYYLEERKYDDICHIMNMNYHSVRNLVHRGMVRLREAAAV